MRAPHAIDERLPPLWPLVLAPSFAGKSFFVVHSHDPRFVDGDLIIAATMGWPEGAWWRKSGANRLHRMHAATLKAWSRDDKWRRSIVFWGHRKALVDAFGPSAIALVLPPLATLKKNRLTRTQMQPGRPAPPEDDLIREYHATFAWAREARIPSFTSFEALATVHVAREEK